MDLHEKRQRDPAEHMARVNQQVARAKAHARPWRSIIALVLAVAAATVATQAGREFEYWTGKANLTPKLVAAGCIAAFCAFAAIAVVGLAGKARDVLSPAVGTGHAAVVRYAILLVGGAATLVVAIDLMKVPVGQLLVGGAVTTILLGIAGQQALANVFAGLVLLLSRPFTVGDFIRLKSGALGGVTEGQVTEIGITYLRIETEDGVLNLPNSQVLAAAVGPMARPQRAGGPAPAGAAAGGPRPGTTAGAGAGEPQMPAVPSAAAATAAAAETAAATEAGGTARASGAGAGMAPAPDGDASGRRDTPGAGHDDPPGGQPAQDRHEPSG